MASDSWKRKYIIRLQDGAFVSEILANGHPDRPVIYTTTNAGAAKRYQLINAACKACNRVVSKFGRSEVLRIEWDEKTQRFDLENGKVVWVTVKAKE